MEVLRKKRSHKFILLILFSAAFLEAASLIPDYICRAITRHEAFYIVAHIGSYGTLAFILAIWLRSQRSLFRIRINDFSVVLIAFIITAAFGAITELSQLISFFQRRPCWFDYECNLTGAGGGIILFLVCKYAFEKFFPKVFRKLPLFSLDQSR